MAKQRENYLGDMKGLFDCLEGKFSKLFSNLHSFLHLVLGGGGVLHAVCLLQKYCFHTSVGEGKRGEGDPNRRPQLDFVCGLGGLDLCTVAGPRKEC